MRTIRRGATVILGLAILGGTGPAGADSAQSFVGNNTTGPTFARPIGDGSGGISANVVHYHAQRFQLEADTSCAIHSTQGYDGYLHLYRTSFNPAMPLVNLVDGDDDGGTGIGSSRIPSDLTTPSVALTSGIYILVTSGFGAASVGSFHNLVSCDGAAQPVQGFSGVSFVGVPEDQQIALLDRFQVAIDQVSNHPTGIATPVRFGSSNSAFFWFYNDTNFEVQIKILNACALNNHWWVFFSSSSNQAHRIRVADTTTLQIQTYVRALGPPAPAVTDTETIFPCP